MKNFSIFLHQIGNDWFEFGYYEYDGTDFVADMAALEKEPRNQYWLEICNPMQIPLQGEIRMGGHETGILQRRLILLNSIVF